MENTLNCEKCIIKTEHISVNNGPTWKKISDPLLLSHIGLNKLKNQ